MRCYGESIDILAQRTDVLSPRMVRILQDLAQDWRRLDDRIEAVTSEIEALSKTTEACRHLMTVPGIGPIISSAIVAAIGFELSLAASPRITRRRGGRLLLTP